MFNKNFLYIFFLVSGLITSCEDQDTDSIFHCRIDRDYRVTKNLSFTVESVMDYRCPKGAYCFWAGDVDIHLKIEHLSLSIDTVMHLYDRRNNPIHVAGHTWKVLDVAPYPDLDNINETGEHFVWMQVSRD